MLLMKKKSEKAKALEDIGFFRTLNQKDLGKIADVCEEVNIDADEEIISEGSMGEAFYLLLDGDLAVLQDGCEIARRHAGEFVGELSLILGEPCNATVKTLVPCRFLMIQRRAFSALLDNAPGLTKRLLKGLALRLRETDQQSIG